MVLSFERSLKCLVGLTCPANQELFNCLFTLLRPFILNLCTQAVLLSSLEYKVSAKFHTLDHRYAIFHLLSSCVEFKIDHCHVTVSVSNSVIFMKTETCL